MTKDNIQADEPYILSLDDDEDFNNLLHVVIKKKGFKIITTETAEEFIAQLKKKKPSLCLIDVNLEQGPGAGFSLLQALRKKYDLSTPIIMLSRRKDDEDIVRALELGASDYVTKPIDDDFLLTKINHYLKHEGMPPLPFYKVSDSDAPCELTWDNEIRAINEYGITLQGSHFIAKGTKLRISGDFIEEISGKKEGIKVFVHHSWILEANHRYQAYCEFDFEDAQLLGRIRSYLTGHH